MQTSLSDICIGKVQEKSEAKEQIQNITGNRKQMK